MIHYSIIESKIFGIKNPLLIYSGWVESSVSKLSIESDGETVIEIVFPMTKAKIHTFSIREPLLTKRENIKYIVNVILQNGKKEKIDEFDTSVLVRLKTKISPSKKDKYKKIVDKKHKKELRDTVDTRNKKAYLQWIQKYETFTEKNNWEYCPLISIVMPVYNVDARYLTACIDSILNQTYQNFEICIADDCSTKQETLDTLKYYENKDKRIKVVYRKENGHISEATNSALSLASGEFIGLMDNDDELMPQALNEVVAVINKNKNIDFIYSDEDKIDPEGNRSDPHFKPDFALEKLYGGNYICHFSVIRKTVIDQVGGFRKGYEGAQDFDLFIRIAQITDKFYHIPKILYHWRMIPGSTAVDAGQKNYAGEAGKRALEDLFEKKGLNVQVDIVISTHYFVQYILKEEPTIDMIMHITKENDGLFDRLATMDNDLSYQNYKFVFLLEDGIDLENQLNDVLKNHLYSIISVKSNFVKTLNQYITKTSAEVLVYLDENGEMKSFDGLDILSSYALQSHIGFVGCKILNINHCVTDSGYFLLENKLLPTTYLTYENDYGYNGNLLVPNNYRVIENSCFAVETKKLKENLFDESFTSFDEAFVWNCLLFDNRNLKNISIPNTTALMEKEETQIQTDIYNVLKKCEEKKIEVVHDKYYNVNLSKLYGFRLDK